MSYQEITLRLTPENAVDPDYVLAFAKKQIHAGQKKVYLKYLKRSIDARKRQIIVQLKVGIQEIPFEERKSHIESYTSVSSAEPILIIGAGPAGYFAALELIELGYKPIIFERGKDVRARRRDLKAIQQDGIVNPHSNYCFGEGGAGTYSDGKLYTRSHKRGNILKSLELLVDHGAKEDILIEAHPHIGSNKLPNLVAKIKDTILHFGGEIHFNSFVTDFLIEGKKIKGIQLEGGETHFAKATILATGHSARDIFSLLDKKGIEIEIKPFAMGVRIEHPQPLIDQIQYGHKERGEYLPASSYKLVCQVANTGVFSFCMCPGGLIVPASTAPGELVVNGMSMSRRDSPFANSGMVVAINEEDLRPFQEKGVFAGLALQQKVERSFFEAGDGTQAAPAQRITDFVNGKTSSTLPSTSYIPGIFSAQMQDLLPDFVGKKLRAALKVFGNKMKGYYTEDAILVGAETRTSSPIRIPRNKETLMHPSLENLFPCGEGAGYAGGILSAAMDGQNVAKAVSRMHPKNTIE